MTHCTELTNRTDVDALVRRFYEQVVRDEILAEPFSDIRDRLEAHLPVMGDFWETTLFRAGLYRRNALKAHRQLNARTALSTPQFIRWLTLWNNTIDQMYQGATAEQAKVQAARIAYALHRRIIGDPPAELAVFLSPTTHPARHTPGTRKPTRGDGDLSSAHSTTRCAPECREAQ